MPHLVDPRRPRRAPTRSSAILVLSALVLISCARKETGATDSAAAPPTPSADAGTTGGAANGRVHLEVTGGPHAGTYDAGMASGGCSYGLAGEGTWGNQYSIDTTDPKTFSSLQLVVPDAKAAAAGTKSFQLTAGFGPIFGQGATSYDVNTRSGSSKGGSGTVTVEDHGTTGKVTFDARTADGVGLKGTIDCASVMRGG